jgi:ParB-like nuclease domain
VEETLRAREDFDAARFRAFRKAVLATLTRRGRGLASMDAALEAAGTLGRSFAGVQEIPLDRVVGSAGPPGKAGDFDPGFLPIDRRLRDRWTRIYRAMVEGEELPPIDVYMVGDNYYVIDGHHRVSVARSLGRDVINARVIEINTTAPLGPEFDAAALLRAAEYRQFLETTRLHELRPEARLEVSRLGRYDEILNHILGHRYFLGLEPDGELSLPKAAASWYDNVYVPVAEVIRKHSVLDHFPGWTEADLYVELSRRWLELSEAGQPSGPDNAARSLLAEDARNWWQRRRSLRLQERRRSLRPHAE